MYSEGEDSIDANMGVFLRVCFYLSECVHEGKSVCICVLLLRSLPWGTFAALLSQTADSALPPLLSSSLLPIYECPC